LRRSLGLAFDQAHSLSLVNGGLRVKLVQAVVASRAS
jgi:hypothetical protein